MVHPYLKNIEIEVVPAPSRGRWTNFVAPEQAKSLENAAPFFPDTLKTFPCPPSKFHTILDNTKKEKCPDFENEEMTERKYFERVLGLNLDPNSAENHFNKHYDSDNKRDRPTMVNIENKLDLNLNNPADMLRYKILLCHTAEIARSKEVYNQEKRPSTLFLMVQKNTDVSDIVEKAMLGAEAAKYYLEIVADKDKMLKFLTTVNKVYDYRTDIQKLKAEVTKIYQADAKAFIDACTDVYADLKWVLTKARQMNVLDMNAANKTFSTKSGERYTFDKLIEYFKDPRNSEEFMDIEIAISEIK
jgi:uncharacterized protein YqgQ